MESMVRAFIWAQSGGDYLGTPPQALVFCHVWDGQNPATEIGGNTNQFPETKIAYDDNENDIRRKIIDVAVRLTGLNKNDIVLVSG